MHTARPRGDDSPTSTTTIGRRVFPGAVPALLLALRDTVEAQGAAFVAYHDALKPAFVTRSPFGENPGVYRAGGTGLQEVRNGLTSAQYQAEFNALTGQGFLTSRPCARIA